MVNSHLFRISDKLVNIAVFEGKVTLQSLLCFTCKPHVVIGRKTIII
jgi:hypothetical protein